MKIDYLNEKKTGLLHIVDLAGSERCATTKKSESESISVILIYNYY